MQAPTNKTDGIAVENGLGKCTASSQSRAASPTPSLTLCQHCGEEYCSDAVIETAEVAHSCKAILVQDASTTSTPAKPLRKKQKLNSLATRAKEQQQVPEACLRRLPANAMLASAIDMDAFIEPLKRDVVKKNKPELMAKLKLEMPSNHADAYGAAEVDDGFVPGADSPERRALDELRKGMKIIYKSQSPIKSPSALKGQSTLKDQSPLKRPSPLKKRSSFFRR